MVEKTKNIYLDRRREINNKIENKHFKILRRQILNLYQ